MTIPLEAGWIYPLLKILKLRNGLKLKYNVIDWSSVVLRLKVISMTPIKYLKVESWVLLLRGAARLQWEDGSEVALQPGDHVLIAAGRRHRVAWTDPSGPTVWLAVHFAA